MQKLYWKGISRDDRIKAISEITDIICRHGTILNFQKFSDVMFSLVVEVEHDKVSSLYKCLSNIMLLEGDANGNFSFTDSCILFFNVTFSKGTGDLEFEVPNIPK